MTTEPLEPGHLIGGRYTIESMLGVGGHAYVYLAKQQGLERPVAIKVLTFDQNSPNHKREVMRKRFEQEARMISQLRDPHTITMYDYGTTDEGLMYMAQEYIEGESLSELFKREGKLEPKRVVKILSQLLYSLQEAHTFGVLHRDIKPQNIMIYSHVGRRDQVKLLDFGIAKLAGESGQDLTAEGSLVGTPRYIAPERIRGKELTPASDLYSVGLVACELLKGTRVMAGKKGIRALQAQLTEPSLTLPEDVDVPNALRQIINKIMEKDTRLRYESADQVLQDLEYWRQPTIPTSNTDNEHDTLDTHNTPDALSSRRSSSSSSAHSTREDSTATQDSLTKDHSTKDNTLPQFDALPYEENSSAVDHFPFQEDSLQENSSPSQDNFKTKSSRTPLPRPPHHSGQHLLYAQLSQATASAQSLQPPQKNIESAQDASPTAEMNGITQDLANVSNDQEILTIEEDKLLESMQHVDPLEAQTVDTHELNSPQDESTSTTTENLPAERTTSTKISNTSDTSKRIYILIVILSVICAILLIAVTLLLIHMVL